LSFGSVCDVVQSRRAAVAVGGVWGNACPSTPGGRATLTSMKEGRGHEKQEDDGEVQRQETEIRTAERKRRIKRKQTKAEWRKSRGSRRGKDGQKRRLREDFGCGSVPGRSPVRGPRVRHDPRIATERCQANQGCLAPDTRWALERRRSAMGAGRRPSLGSGLDMRLHKQGCLIEWFLAVFKES
jgi:hypothetical protein